MNIFHGWIFFRGEYFSGVNIFQGRIFFRGEHFSVVNILRWWTWTLWTQTSDIVDTDMVDTEVNVLQGWHVHVHRPIFSYEFRTVERCLVYCLNQVNYELEFLVEISGSTTHTNMIHIRTPDPNMMTSYDCCWLAKIKGNNDPNNGRKWLLLLKPPHPPPPPLNMNCLSPATKATRSSGSQRAPNLRILNYTQMTTIQRLKGCFEYTLTQDRKIFIPRLKTCSGNISDHLREDP